MAMGKTMPMRPLVRTLRAQAAAKSAAAGGGVALGTGGCCSVRQKA